jgi:hypothetical protein
MWAADTSHDISGRVVDAQTGKPIARASVSLEFKEGEESPVVLTGDDGVFRILHLPNGPVKLMASRRGYLTWSEGQDASFDVVPAASLPFTTLRLMRESVIHGVVVGEENAPIRYADMLLMDAEGKPGEIARFLKADDAGAYRLGNLSAGRYLVAAVGGVACAPKGMEYGKRYYPNVIERSEAKSIDLEAGQDAEVKIQLNAMPMREVRGRVMPMVPGSRAQILEFDSLNIFQEWDEGSQTFRFYNLPSGEYILRASGALDGKRLSATQTIVIRDADINGIVLELHENR